MAGHSKWANIKHKKERADAKKGKEFSRCAKEIISAVKQGGPDQKANARLRLAVQKAKAANVPNEVIDRNIKKASSADQADYFEMTYELYGHGGVGIIVDIMTDNKNRIASEIRIATNKRGGTVANQGAVSFNFDRKGILQIDKSTGSEEELFEKALEAGSEDFDHTDDAYIVITAPDELYQVKENLDAASVPTKNPSLEMIPKTLVEVDQETFEKNTALIEWLESIDDVDATYHNMTTTE